MIAVSAIAVPAVVASSAHASVELSFWSWRPEDTAFWTAQAAKFQAATGISVKYTPYVATDYNATLATALTAGKGPDVMLIRAYGGMANLSDAGNFLPLTTKDVPLLAKMAPGTLAGAQGYKDKHQFGVPYSTSVLGVLYNPDILSKVGIQANPTSWASLLAAMDRVKRAGYTALAVGTGYAPGLEQMWAAIAPAFYGGNAFYNDIVAGNKTFNDPAFVASLKAETDLYPYMPAGASGLDYNTQRALFANGKAAFYIGGNYEISYFRSLNPTAPIGWLLAAMDRVKRAGYTALAVGTGYAPGLEQMWAAIAPAFYGGNAFYNDIVAGNKTFNDPAFVASLKAETDLYPYMPAGASGLDYNTQRALFANGKAAFYIGGNYEISYFRSLNPTAPIGWFPAPAATQGGARYVTNWADGAFAINAKTTHKAEALKFLNFIASKTTMQAGADSLGWIPPVTGIQSSDPAIIAMARHIKPMGTPFLTLVGFRYGTPTSSSIMQPGFQKVASGAMTVTELAKAIQDGVATWYAPLKGK